MDLLLLAAKHGGAKSSGGGATWPQSGRVALNFLKLSTAIHP